MREKKLDRRKNKRDEERDKERVIEKDKREGGMNTELNP